MTGELLSELFTFRLGVFASLMFFHIGISPSDNVFGGSLLV